MERTGRILRCHRERLSRRMEETINDEGNEDHARRGATAGTCGLAMAQGGGGGEPSRGSDANPPSAVKQQPGESKSAPANQGAGAAQGTQMQQRNTGMSTTPATAGSETGTAKDPAGPGAEAEAPGGGVKSEHFAM